MRYKLVVFDWDGTLSDSAGAIVDSMIEASRDLGIAEPDPGRARYTIGLGMVDALRLAGTGSVPLSRICRQLSSPLRVARRQDGIV